MGGMRLSVLEAEGLAWLVEEASRVGAEVGAQATETSVLKALLRAELTRRGWPKAHLLKRSSSEPDT
jgi:hypothetical protein